MVTSVEIEGGGEGCLNRFKILLQSLTLTLQVYCGGRSSPPEDWYASRSGWCHQPIHAAYCCGFSRVENSKQLVSRRELEVVSRQSRTCLFPSSSSSSPRRRWRLLPPLPPLPEVVTWALAEPPGCCLGGGLSECEEGAAKSEISIVTQDAPGAELERAREEGAPARPPAVLGAPQPPRAVPGPASLSQLGSD